MAEVSLEVILEELYVHGSWGYYGFEAFPGFFEEIVEDADDHVDVYGSFMRLVQDQAGVVW